ncbi:MAG: hypothetical protein ACC628_21055, partial [Pirellulaceae bacterium]
EVARVLPDSGIEAPAGDAGISSSDDLRALFKNSRLQVETDTDSSRRIRLTTEDDQDDQLVWTANDEFVVTHRGIAQNGYNLDRRLVCADTTCKGANELTKLRLWQVVTDALEQVEAIGKPGRPKNLEIWMRQNKEETERLHQQINAIGLAAEKTHQFSARVFEPALLAPFQERCLPLRKAFAQYFVAEAIRERVNEETRRRLLAKSADPKKRRMSHLRMEKLNARAAELYGNARDLFDRALATSLAGRCKAMTDAHAEATELHVGSAADHGDRWGPQLRAETSRREYEEARKLIDVEDETVANTVLTINRLQNRVQQQRLERHLANHLMAVARQIQNPHEMNLLQEKICALKSVVTENTYINPQRLQRFLALVRQQRLDLLPGQE